jgi:hypothetical protein
LLFWAFFDNHELIYQDSTKELTEQGKGEVLETPKVDVVDPNVGVDEIKNEDEHEQEKIQNETPNVDNEEFLKKEFN